MREFYTNFKVLFIVLGCVALLAVGCAKDYTGDAHPHPDHVDEALDDLGEDEWDFMMSLPPLPYAPPPNLTDNDAKSNCEEPKQSGQSD